MSPLADVHTLRLKGLPKVTDVGMLGSVHTLELVGMDGVESVRGLERVRWLRVERCGNVSDLGCLRKSEREGRKGGDGNGVRVLQLL